MPKKCGHPTYDAPHWSRILCAACGESITVHDVPRLAHIMKHATSQAAAKHKVTAIPLFPSECPHCGVLFLTDLEGTEITSPT